MTSKKQSRMAAIVAALFTLTLTLACGDDGTNTPQQDQGITDTIQKTDGIAADTVKPDTVPACTLPDVIAKPKTAGKEMWTCVGNGTVGKGPCFFYAEIYKFDGKTCTFYCVQTKGSDDKTFTCKKNTVTTPTGISSDKFTCVDMTGETITCE